MPSPQVAQQEDADVEVGDVQDQPYIQPTQFELHPYPSFQFPSSQFSPEFNLPFPHV